MLRDTESDTIGAFQQRCLGKAPHLLVRNCGVRAVPDVRARIETIHALTAAANRLCRNVIVFGLFSRMMLSASGRVAITA